MCVHLNDNLSETFKIPNNLPEMLQIHKLLICSTKKNAKYMPGAYWN